MRHTIAGGKANKIPEEIVIDLTGRDIGDPSTSSSIQLPEGSRPVIRDRDFTIATIVGRKVEEVVAAPTAARGFSRCRRKERRSAKDRRCALPSPKREVRRRTCAAFVGSSATGREIRRQPAQYRLHGRGRDSRARTAFGRGRRNFAAKVCEGSIDGVRAVDHEAADVLQR